MTDQPEAALAVMRRQLDMVLSYDDSTVDAILTADSNDEIEALGLDDRDTEILRRLSQAQLEDLFGVSQADAEALRELADHMELLGESEYSINRQEFLLRRNFILAKQVGGLADALTDRDPAEDIVRYINREKDGSPETNKDYRTAFRMFGTLLTDGDDPPPSIAWVPGGYPSTHDPAPRPEKMYRWEEHIVPMLDACTSSRDRALVALAWDVGPRPGELYDLTVDRFSDHEYGMKVTLYQGKKGTRSPILVPAVPYVQQWLDDHPAGQTTDAPLWSKRNEPERISNNRIRDIFKEVAERADMTPPSTPTPRRMRKSSASHLASQPDTSQVDLEDHHGWKRNSDVASRYVSVFSEAHDRAIAAAHGVDVSADEPEPTGPIECDRCGQETPRHKAECIHCGFAMSKAAARRQEREQREATTLVAEMLDDEDASSDEVAAMVDALVTRRTKAEVSKRLDGHES